MAAVAPNKLKARIFPISITKVIPKNDVDGFLNALMIIIEVGVKSNKHETRKYSQKNR